MAMVNYQEYIPTCPAIHRPSNPLYVKLQLRLPPPPVALQHQPPERMLSSELWFNQQTLQGWNPIYNHGQKLTFKHTSHMWFDHDEMYLQYSKPEQKKNIQRYPIDNFSVVLPFLETISPQKKVGYHWKIHINVISVGKTIINHPQFHHK